MANIRIGSLPTYTGDTTGAYLVMNDSGNTTTYKVLTDDVANNIGVLGITIDGAGSVITTGLKGYLVVPYDATIESWSVVADTTGSIVLDVWKSSSYTIPGSAADSIAGTEKPTLSSQQINTDLSLTTWTTSLLVGDVIGFNVDSASTITRATIEIKVKKL